MIITTETILENLKTQHGTTVTRQQITDTAKKLGVSLSTALKRLKPYKSSRGVWNLTIAEKLEKNFKTKTAKPMLVDSFDTAYLDAKDLVPAKDPNYVPFGNFNDIKKVIKSGIFYPTFITGLSGNGKTFGVEQACAQLGRQLIRVNITIETDEDDLIGGFRLVNGETVWHNGPVIEALNRGAILLLDEIDLASNKILCLQSILEGSGVYLKKIGSFVRPQRGFNVIATANTKGKGSDDGRFIGTNVLNEAFLERFALTFEQEYPSETVEQKILTALDIQLNGKTNKTFIENLTKWADIIRKTFAEGGVDEVISTRRLTHIVRAFSIFKNETKAIQVCLNRFDEETKQSFLDLYDKIVMPEEVAEEKTTAKTGVVDIETFS